MMARTLLSTLLTAATLFAVACSSTPMPAGPTAAAVEVPPVSAPLPPAPKAAPTSARYRVTFQATWSAATHPLEFPASAHFSPLVGGTHAAQVTFWREGVPATTGIKDMAERGLTSTLTQELNAAIAAGTAQYAFTGGGIGSSPGLATAEFEISLAYPLVTLVSMIAPTPDWFVGVAGLPLFEDGQWVDERRIELLPWDAGTDSGQTFTSPDLVTSPPAPIARIVSAPLAPNGRPAPLGTFTFTRLP